MLWGLILRKITFFIATSNAILGELLNFQEKTTVDMLQQAGYPVEIHNVTTQDGYQLTLHRIPYGRNAAEKTPAKKPILLVHGLLCSSADWIVTGENSLGLQLANAGYDVWMGNNRGNSYSRKHKILRPDRDAEKFFSFSFHELGKYDAPAMIDYILETTNTSKIPYVGYSQGTTQFLVMMSERPEYNDKISSMVSWAPVTDMFQTNNKLINLLRDVPLLEKIGEIIRWYEMFRHEKIGNIYRGLCKLSDTVCSFVFGLLGQSSQRMPSRVMKQKILTNFPAGMSRQQLLHYVQGARHGTFKPYDYGKEQNLIVYRKHTPDSYDLSKVRCNMTLFYADADGLVNNDRLLNLVVPQLTNAHVKTIAIESEFDHLDFIWSKDAKYLARKTLKVLEHDTTNNGEDMDKPTTIDSVTYTIFDEEISGEHTTGEDFSAKSTSHRPMRTLKPFFSRKIQLQKRDLSREHDDGFDTTTPSETTTSEASDNNIIEISGGHAHQETFSAKSTSRLPIGSIKPFESKIQLQKRDLSREHDDGFDTITPFETTTSEASDNNIVEISGGHAHQETFSAKSTSRVPIGSIKPFESKIQLQKRDLSREHDDGFDTTTPSETTTSEASDNNIVQIGGGHAHQEIFSAKSTSRVPIDPIKPFERKIQLQKRDLSREHDDGFDTITSFETTTSEASDNNIIEISGGHAHQETFSAKSTSRLPIGSIKPFESKIQLQKRDLSREHDDGFDTITPFETTTSEASDNNIVEISGGHAHQETFSAKSTSRVPIGSIKPFESKIQLQKRDLSREHDDGFDTTTPSETTTSEASDNLDFIKTYVKYLTKKTVKALNRDASNNGEVMEKLTAIDSVTSSISDEDVSDEHTTEEHFSTKSSRFPKRKTQQLQERDLPRESDEEFDTTTPFETNIFAASDNLYFIRSKDEKYLNKKSPKATKRDASNNGEVIDQSTTINSVTYPIGDEEISGEHTSGEDFSAKSTSEYYNTIITPYSRFPNRKTHQLQERDLLKEADDEFGTTTPFETNTFDESDNVDFVRSKDVNYLNKQIHKALKHNSTNNGQVTDKSTIIDSVTSSISDEEISDTTEEDFSPKSASDSRFLNRKTLQLQERDLLKEADDQFDATTPFETI